MRFVGVVSQVGLVGVVAVVGCGDAASTPAPHATAAPAPASGDAAAPGYPKGINDTPPGASVDAGSAADGATPVPPLVAPDDAWTWLDVPGTECANGTPTGVGVNFSHRTDDVLIFLEGGGACWDAASCYGVVSTAFYIGGYGKAQFDSDVQRPVMLPLLKDDARNPFKDMSIVYVPYCTGDVHAGNRVVTYDYGGTSHVTHHVGGKNFGIILDRVVATFPNAKHVWVAGDSAGGFGAALNFGRVQDAFVYARVGVLDDSGQPVQPSKDRWQQWKDAWGLVAPPECPACADDIGAYVGYYRERFPNNRFGLVSYTNDSIISTFMGLSGADFATELDALGAKVDASWPYAKYFFINGISHVGLLGASPELIAWMQQLVSWDPAWASARH